MQKFNKGDHVMVAKDLGQSMRHFTKDCEAIVIGSYSDQYGGSDSEKYTIHIKGQGRTSWYYGGQLTMIRRGAYDLLDQWETEEQAFIAQNSDIDWIFENGPSVAEKPSGATLAKLFSCIRDGSMWGRSGEGFIWQENARGTLYLAHDFLIRKDKDGWLEFANQFRLQDN